MLAYVHSIGLAPRCLAAFSAGSPNASHPNGLSTACPVMRLWRTNASWIVKISACPMCRSPEGYGNIVSA